MREAAAEGKGAVSLDGRLIDAASIRMAENLLAKLEQIEARDPLAVARGAVPSRPSPSVETAADLQAACRELLPGYAARREPDALGGATRGVPRAPARRADGEPGPPAAERFDAFAFRLILDPKTIRAAPLITCCRRRTDMLCALWLARRSGLVLSGPEGAMRGRRSPARAGLPVLSPPVARGLHARHAIRERRLQAPPGGRGEHSAIHLAADAESCTRRLARQARSWGVAAAQPTPPSTRSEPGVVRRSPVSSSVFRPERIIGQPP